MSKENTADSVDPDQSPSVGGLSSGPAKPVLI